MSTPAIISVDPFERPLRATMAASISIGIISTLALAYICLQGNGYQFLVSSNGINLLTVGALSLVVFCAACYQYRNREAVTLTAFESNESSLEDDAAEAETAPEVLTGRLSAIESPEERLGLLKTSILSALGSVLLAMVDRFHNRRPTDKERGAVRTFFHDPGPIDENFKATIAAAGKEFFEHQAKDRDNATLLHLAIRCGKLTIAQLIFKRIQEVKAALIADKDGVKPHSLLKYNLEHDLLKGEEWKQLEKELAAYASQNAAGSVALNPGDLEKWGKVAHVITFSSPIVQLLNQINQGIQQVQGLTPDRMIPSALSAMAETLETFPNTVSKPSKTITLEKDDYLRCLIHAYNIKNFAAVERLLKAKPDGNNYTLDINLSTEKYLRVLARVILPAANNFLRQETVYGSFAHVCKLMFIGFFADFYPDDISEGMASEHNKLLTQEFEHNQEITNKKKHIAFLNLHKEREDLLNEILKSLEEKSHDKSHEKRIEVVAAIRKLIAQPKETVGKEKQMLFHIPLSFSIYNSEMIIPKDIPFINGKHRLIDFFNWMTVQWYAAGRVIPWISPYFKDTAPIIDAVFDPLFGMLNPKSEFRNVLKIFDRQLPHLQKILTDQAQGAFDREKLLSAFVDHCRNVQHSLLAQ